MKEKENICGFNYLKVPDAISCNTGSGWIAPQDVGVSSCLGSPDSLCKHDSIPPAVQRELRLQTYHTTFIFFQLIY